MGQFGTSFIFKNTGNIRGVGSKKIKIPNVTNEEIAHEQSKKLKDISCEVFYPKAEKDQQLPVIIYLHGGAFVFHGTQYHKRIIFDLVLNTNAVVVYVDYSLAPEYPYPYALNECYDVYEYITSKENPLNIKQDEIGIIGDSAGGNLAAALCQKIRDEKIQQPLFQMLIYPVLNAAQDTVSMVEFTDTPRWNSTLNEEMWELYLPEINDVKEAFANSNIPEEVYIYASPLANPNLEGLPITYIEVAEIDSLRDEGILYGEKLSEVGIPTELYLNKGAIHGFELNYNTDYTQDTIKRRIAFINEILN